MRVERTEPHRDCPTPGRTRRYDRSNGTPRAETGRTGGPERAELREYIRPNDQQPETLVNNAKKPQLGSRGERY